MWIADQVKQTKWNAFFWWKMDEKVNGCKWRAQSKYTHMDTWSMWSCVQVKGSQVKGGHVKLCSKGLVLFLPCSSQLFSSHTFHCVCQHPHSTLQALRWISTFIHIRHGKVMGNPVVPGYFVWSFHCTQAFEAMSCKCPHFLHHILAFEAPRKSGWYELWEQSYMAQEMGFGSDSEELIGSSFAKMLCNT